MGQRPATYFLARDRLIPRQFANRGDRLAFSNGILILALLSALQISGADKTHHASGTGSHLSKIPLSRSSTTEATRYLRATLLVSYSIV
jgi:hypothetical protein